MLKMVFGDCRPGTAEVKFQAREMSWITKNMLYEAIHNSSGQSKPNRVCFIVSFKVYRWKVVCEERKFGTKIYYLLCSQLPLQFKNTSLTSYLRYFNIAPETKFWSRNMSHSVLFMCKLQNKNIPVCMIRPDGIGVTGKRIPNSQKTTYRAHQIDSQALTSAISPATLNVYGESECGFLYINWVTLFSMKIQARTTYDE